MQVSLTPQAAPQVPADVLVAPIFEDEKFESGPLKELDDRLGGLLTQMLQWKELSGKAYKTAMLPGGGHIAAGRLLVVGCGRRADFDGHHARRVGAAVGRHLAGRHASSLAVALPGQLPEAVEVRALVEGLVRGQYEPDKYKTEDREAITVQQLTVVVSPQSGMSVLEGEAQVGRLVGEAANYARGLANEPASNMTPTLLAKEAETLAQDYHLEFQALGPEELEALGAGALLGVARGSAEPPRLICLRYRGAPSDKPVLALVGKGLTFDSGGLSLKPSDAMKGMKADMAGAAAVLGAMQVIAQLKPPVNVLGVIPASENMPGSRALRPGDVLKAINGKTIEVENTDAEGRLVLADALGYAQKQGATHLVDIATLTGACIIALGRDISGLMGAPQEWVNQVSAAASSAGEQVWQLPLPADYKSQLKSEIADLKNVGGRPAGTITGALVIKEFVDEGVAWAHLDIAGPAWNENDRPYLPEGATGAAVSTLVELALGFGKPAQ